MNLKHAVQLISKTSGQCEIEIEIYLHKIKLILKCVHVFAHITYQNTFPYFLQLILVLRYVIYRYAELIQYSVFSVT